MKLLKWPCYCALACGIASAQPDYALHATPVGPAPVDPAIARALTTIKPQSNTTDDQNAGWFRYPQHTFPAWIPICRPARASTPRRTGSWPVRAISRECGGCLEVKRDTFTADPASGAAPWARPNSQADTNHQCLRHSARNRSGASQAHGPGHRPLRFALTPTYANWADTSGAAPGANDDASGVAVSLECARALSKMKFPGTIVFVAVAGEEQGLVGSAHLAKLAKDEGWDLEAVLNNDIVGGNTTPGDTLQLKDRVRVFSEGVPQAATPEEARRIRASGQRKRLAQP